MQEIEASYKTLKAKYSEDRFLDGEAGRVGAVNLMELEEAFQAVSKEREEQVMREAYGDEFAEADSLVKANRLDEAQSVLDRIHNRSGKWHFLQSVIFYKRNWFSESKAQLQIAINLDPENAGYKDAMQRLDQTIANEHFRPKIEDVTQRPVDDTAMETMRCCNTLCCMSLCCDSMQCCF